MDRRTLMGGVAIAALMSLGAGVPAAAQEGADFFNGRTVDYVVATEAGGGYDTYARLVAEFMQRHLPGSTFVVRNMPGAGHIVGANYIYSAEPDGLTIGTFNTAMVYSQIAGVGGIQFDMREMSYIGKAASDPRVIVMSEQSGIETVEDLFENAESLRFGSHGVGSADYVDVMMLQRALDLPVQLITGYSGNENELAMMRGEIQGAMGSRSSYVPFVEEGSGRFIAQIGGDDADLPQLSEYVESELGEDILALMEAQSNLVRLTAAPPGISEDRLDALQAAYEAAVSDPEFLARAEAAGLPIDPLDGDGVAAQIERQFNLDEETLQFVRDVLG